MLIKLEQLNEYVCVPEASVHDILGRINAAPYLFQIVVDEAGRLLGTVTDGDVRRGMLQGVTFQDPVSACMQSKPITGIVGDDLGNSQKLQAVSRHTAFLPILDPVGVVREILIGTRKLVGISTALVMAGGEGRRLGELTRETPKPLLSVGDGLILEHVLDALEKYGISNIYISVHYLADRVRQFVEARSNRCNIHIVHEDTPLGTAGSIGLLPNVPDGPVLVVNGDIITRADFSALDEFHHGHSYDATIGVTRYDFDIPFGVVRRTDDGLFVGIEEKPVISHFVAAGIYCLSPEVCSLVRRNEPLDMPASLNLGRSIGFKVGLFPIHEYWIDVGQPEDLQNAERDHLARSNEQDG